MEDFRINFELMIGGIMNFFFSKYYKEKLSSNIRFFIHDIYLII